MPDPLLRDADPNYLLNVIQKLEARLKALEMSFISANHVDEAFTGAGNLLNNQILSITETGIQKFNGFYSAEDGSSYMKDVGYLDSITGSTNGKARTARIGLQDNTLNPEFVTQFFEPGTGPTIENFDFSSLSLDNWTEKKKGTGLQAILASNKSIAPNATVVDSAGNIYFGFSGGAVTSSVWKYTVATATFAALGTLNTAFAITGMAIDSAGNLFVSIGSGAVTSSVWKYTLATTTWAALGALNVAFSLKGIVIDSAGNLYVGIGSGAVTSSLWKYTLATTTWAALGALSVAFAVKSVAVDSAGNVYAGMSSGATTSGIWKYTLATTTWAALGNLATTAAVGKVGLDSAGNVYAAISSGLPGGSPIVRYTNKWVDVGAMAKTADTFMFDANDILYVGIGVSGSLTSMVYRFYNNTWAEVGSAAAVIGTTCENIVFGASGDMYATEIDGSSNNYIYKYNVAYSWSGANGYATVQNITGTPELELITRFPVTVGDWLRVTAGSSALVSAGSVYLAAVINFYTLITGGSLVSKKIVFARTVTADSDWLEMDGLAQVPTGATYATVSFVTFGTGTTANTANFSKAYVEIANKAVETILDDWLRFKYRATKMTVPMVLYKATSNNAPGIANAFTLPAFDVTLPGGFLTGNNGIMYDIRFYLDTNANNRAVTVNLYYGTTLLATAGSTFPLGSLMTFHLTGNIVPTGTNAQRGYIELLYTNTTATAILNHYLREGIGSENASVDKNIKLEIVVAGSVDAFNIYDTTVTALFAPS